MVIKGDGFGMGDKKIKKPECDHESCMMSLMLLVVYGSGGLNKFFVNIF